MRVKKNFAIVLALSLGIAMAACGQKTGTTTADETTRTEASQDGAVDQAADNTAEAEVTQEDEGTTSYEAQTIKEKPDIKDDFYTHMNYEYLTGTKIPKGESSNGNFDDLAKKTRASITDLLKELNGKYDSLAAGSEEKKVVDFYNMAVDFSKRDELGISPVAAHLESIRAAKSIKDISSFIEENFANGYGQLVRFVVDKDLKNKNGHALYIMEPQIGMEKKYYVEQDDFSKKIRDAYLAYIEKLLIILGYEKDAAAKRAQEVYDFEKKIMEASLNQEEKMNFEKTYNPVTLQELGALVGNYPLDKALSKNGIKDSHVVIAEQTEMLKALNSQFTDGNLEIVKSFMELDIVKKNSTALSKEVLMAEAEYDAAFEGVLSADTDEDLAYSITDKIYGFSLGRLYAERYFSPEAKEKVTAMAKEILETYKRRLGEVDWISDETRKGALKKLDNLGIKIGYPDVWKDFSATEVKSYAEGGNLVAAIESMSKKNMDDSFAKLDQAPDRSEWVMASHYVNAAYNPLSNDITFTAAILQAPFYSPDRSDVENMGGIGTVIGHEISHAFDNMGSKFDENGSLNNWWTEEDMKKLQEKADKAAAIYSALEVVDGHHVNGEISTGEIMADLGGMTVVLDIARQKNLDTKKIFESYSSVWRSVNTKEALIAGLTDEHPPTKYRVNNIVNLMDDFYKDFDIKEGDGMYVKPEDRLKVW